MESEQRKSVFIFWDYQVSNFEFVRRKLLASSCCQLEVPGALTSSLGEFHRHFPFQIRIKLSWFLGVLKFLRFSNDH